MSYTVITYVEKFLTFLPKKFSIFRLFSLTSLIRCFSFSFSVTFVTFVVHGPNNFSKEFSSSFLSCFSWVVKSVCLLFNGLNLRLKQEFAFGISKYVIKVQDFDI